MGGLLRHCCAAMLPAASCQLGCKSMHNRKRPLMAATPPEPACLPACLPTCRPSAPLCCRKLLLPRRRSRQRRQPGVRQRLAPGSCSGGWMRCGACRCCLPGRHLSKQPAWHAQAPSAHSNHPPNACLCCAMLRCLQMEEHLAAEKASRQAAAMERALLRIELEAKLRRASDLGEVRGSRQADRKQERKKIQRVPSLLGRHSRSANEPRLVATAHACPNPTPVLISLTPHSACPLASRW